SLGAECVTPIRLMKRKNYDFPGDTLNKERNAWVRVRDEGGKITMSYKQLDSMTVDGIQEVNLQVDSFDAAGQFLEALGLLPKTYQENKRESWRYKDVEIELDEWPWAKPFVELEGPDERSLQRLATQLGLDWQAVRHGDMWPVYSGEYEVEYG